MICEKTITQKNADAVAFFNRLNHPPAGAFALSGVKAGDQVPVSKWIHFEESAARKVSEIIGGRE